MQLMEDFDDEMDLLIDVLKKQNKESLMVMDHSADPKIKNREIRNLKGIVQLKEPKRLQSKIKEF